MKHISKEILEVPFSHNGHNQTAPIRIYSSGVDNGEKPIMVMPGMGEEQLVAVKLARYFRKIGQPALVGVLTFPTIESIDPMVRKGPGVMAARVNQLFGDDKESPVKSIGHSQSAGAQIVAAPGTPQFAGGRHATIAGVGANTPLLGETPEERSDEFWGRFEDILVRPQSLDPRDWRMGVDFGKFLARDIIQSRLKNGYNILPHKINYGLSDSFHEDYIKGVKYITEHGSLANVTGIKEPLFPGHEHALMMERYGLTDRVAQLHAPGGHEPMTSANGRRQLHVALDFVNDRQPAQPAEYPKAD